MAVFGVQHFSKFVFVWLVYRSSFYRVLHRHFDVWDFQIVVFAWNVLRKSINEIAFSTFGDGFSTFFDSLGNCFSDFHG